MSLINRMLRDLDKRHAPAGPLAGPATLGMSQHAHAVPPRALASDFFWRTMAMLMLFAVGWIAWVVWQLTPHNVVTDLAYQGARAKAAPASTAAPAKDPAPPSPAPVAAQPKPESPVAVAAKPPEAPRKTARPQFDMLKLATELTTPIPQRRAATSRAAAKRPAPQTKVASAQPVRAAATPAAGKIDRRADTSSKYRAEEEFRRAVSLVNQGRVAEGMEGFRTALQLDPSHETARQTLVALLLEAKRVDEAASILQDGLAVNPDNTGFAMLLARIMVERNDVSGALFVLQRHAAPPDRNPGFHAFAGALYQRLDRHKEAIEQYETALRLAPSAGVWWVGLGISLQASERSKEALEAYARAKSAGNLAPELLSFVDQRLRQLK
jgi:MSHA biogenesis protein MshN